jgi:hypothetical protein
MSAPFGSWQDYRRGLETIYAKLNQGIEEDAEVVEFIRVSLDGVLQRFPGCQTVIP